jgi:hypothetical protein
MVPIRICQYQTLEAMRTGLNEAAEEGYRIETVVTHEETIKKYDAAEDSMKTRTFRVWTVFLRLVQ